MVAAGVVTGRPYAAKRIVSLTRHHQINRLHYGARGMLSCLQTPGVEHDVVAEVDHADRWRLALDPAQLRLGMNP